MGIIGAGVYVILTILYSVVIFVVLHSMFNYVFFGDGFSSHLLGVIVGGAILAGITVALWKVIAVIVAIAGVLVAYSSSGNKRVVAVITTLVLLGIIVITGLWMEGVVQ